MPNKTNRSPLTFKALTFNNAKQLVISTSAALAAVLLLSPAPALSADAADRQLLWGDTHVHTSYSFDAFLNGNHSADPDTAYRYAKGLPVIHPYNRTRVQINTPLDFLVIADHAEFYGGIRDIYQEGVQAEDPNIIQRLLYWYSENQIRDAIDGDGGPAYFVDLLPDAGDPIEAAKSWAANTSDRTPPGADISKRNAWERLRASAATHNEPDTFTTLIGWEWSAVPGGSNLHRVVLTDADSTKAGEFLPYASTVSPYPEDLWKWMGETEERIGARFLAIPHNSNISKGQMFGEQTLRGEPLTADYAKQRRRWEPLVEVTQIKGDSETHPVLSPEDPFADFELYPWYIQKVRTDNYQARAGDYVRSALKRGLEVGMRTGENPYQFGMIGSTDSHTGLASAEEPNFWGKMAYDSVPENKQGRALGAGPTGWTMQAAGLAAVWADANNRSAIVDAMQRRETYATTGPRIAVRVFGGFRFTQEDLDAKDMANRGYSKGVPMGGELQGGPNAPAPTFLLSVSKDPKSANLDRAQIIKGWVDAQGTSHEKIYDVVWSGDRQMQADGSLEPVGDTVDKATGRWTNNIGAASLAAYWQDPDFDPSFAAFYYLRTLQIPTPRHALLDAIALGLDEATEGPKIIQERAYSSPIWYKP